MRAECLFFSLIATQGFSIRKPISLMFLALGLIYLIIVFLKRTSLLKKQGSA